ncbi:MAG TPA: hypothetical protein VM094_02700 [Gemmatimonadales bacterium]|nr:hypothetical protein [Gemmatimonadales bacterium]
MPRLSIAVALYLLMPGVVAAQRDAMANDFLGITRCEAGRAVTNLRPDVRDSMLVAEIEAHESVHRDQAAEHESCDPFLATLTSARRIIDAELPAYCAQWKVAVARGADSAITRREFAWRIAAQSGAMENRLQIAQRFEEECR